MVEAIVLLGLTAVAVPTGVYVGIRHKRAVRQAWYDAARLAGLRDVRRETSFFSSDILTGYAGAHRVVLGSYAHGQYDRGTRLAIEGGSDLSLLPSSSVSAMTRSFGLRDFATGDEEFDGEVHVRGDHTVLCAVLDVETRRLARDLLQGRLWPKETPRDPFPPGWPSPTETSCSRFQPCTHTGSSPTFPWSCPPC
jgi:hypothetical protein